MNNAVSSPLNLQNVGNSAEEGITPDSLSLKSQIEKLHVQIKEYEQRMTTFQSDIFAKTNENRKLMAQIKDLQSK